MDGAPLLDADEPPPVAVHRPQGRAALLLVCDHAGRRIPQRCGRLGLDEAEFERHIAWDIGAAAVSRQLAECLDAVLIEQAYSRLVIDCNRPPEVAGSIPEISEATPIPGNVGLDEGERESRRREIFRPYHARIAAEIDRREAAGQPTLLIAMHSFTPVYHGVGRPWHVGTLYGRDGRLAAALRHELLRERGLTVGDNEPYAVSDATDHTIPVHGERRGLPHVGIEIRQDLIAATEGQSDWTAILARALPAAAAALGRRP